MTNKSGIIDIVRNPFFHDSWYDQSYPLTKHRKEQLEKLFGQDEASIKNLNQNEGAYPAFVGIRWGFAEMSDEKKLTETDVWHYMHMYDGYGQPKNKDKQIRWTSQNLHVKGQWGLKLFISILMLFIINMAVGQTFNLNKFTLNDSILREINIEKLTEMLGRPSAIERPDQLISNNYFGPKVYYHEKGLEFTFPPKDRDPKQRLENIKVYLVKTWDKDHKEFYYPFPGKITPQLNSNMKINDLLPLFKSYKVEIVTADTLRKKLEIDYKKVNINYNPNTVQCDVVRVSNNVNHVVFECEEITKYIESFTIWYGKSKP